METINPCQKAHKWPKSEVGRMNDLCEHDVVLWCERQASLLRRRAAGELVNDAELDWPNIAEEIETVGRNEIRACESHLVQALVHMLKGPGLAHVPGRAAVGGGGTRTVRRSAGGVAQRIDVATLYRRALRRLHDGIDGVTRPPVPPTV